MRPRTVQGDTLDAQFEVERDESGLSLIVESRSGKPRLNPDYNPALQLLLERLGDLGGSISVAVVESAKLADWQEDQREIEIDGHPYPVLLTPDLDKHRLRQLLGRGMGRVGRTPGATGGGNPTKRIRLRLAFTTPQRLDDLRRYLVNGAAPRYWALLANPKAYDIVAAVEDGGSDVWTLPQGNPRPGDRGLIWMAKGAGKHRGVVAFFVVTAGPADIQEPAESRARWRNEPPALVTRRIRYHYVRSPGLPLWLDTHAELLSNLSVSRSQGNKLYKVDPEQWGHVVAAAGGWADDPEGPDGPGGGSGRGGQGHIQDAKKKKAIELYAMECARRHFTALGWPEPTDTSQGKPYDWLFVNRDGAELRVEVKGTQGGPAHVLVTIGEVKSAHEAPTALFVQSGISVKQADSGDYQAVGGDSLVVDPWVPDDAALEALTFRHFLEDQ